MNDNVLNIKQTAELIGMSVVWLRKQLGLQSAGAKTCFSVSPYKIGKSLRFNRQEVIGWLENQKRQ